MTTQAPTTTAADARPAPSPPSSSAAAAGGSDSCGSVASSAKPPAKAGGAKQGAATITLGSKSSLRTKSSGPRLVDENKIDRCGDDSEGEEEGLEIEGCQRGCILAYCRSVLNRCKYSPLLHTERTLLLGGPASSKPPPPTAPVPPAVVPRQGGAGTGPVPGKSMVDRQHASREVGIRLHASFLDVLSK
jgi:hypothetical protein